MKSPDFFEETHAIRDKREQVVSGQLSAVRYRSGCSDHWLLVTDHCLKLTFQ
jgi:hypothetical protein